MPNPVSVSTVRLNNSASTTSVSNYFAQADVRIHQDAVLPDRDKVFLPVIAGNPLNQ